jgi:hypothetical protein
LQLELAAKPASQLVKLLNSQAKSKPEKMATLELLGFQPWQSALAVVQECQAALEAKHENSLPRQKG